jgi:spore coat protein CotH
MKTSHLSCGLAILGFALAWPATTSRAADGEVNLTFSNDAVMLKVDGDHDDDWWIQTSTDLTTWTTLTNFGTLISGNETNAPWRSAGAPANSQRFYRALQTAGLYDPVVFHTISLTFTQANWGTALANARTANTNIYCSLLTLDNGATNYSVGARYKGNSSYSMGGTKKSINLDIDWVDTDANLMDYTTVNLNNAAGDETIMREPLFFTIMNQYTPCPKGSMARVHINGSLWGVYSLIQQENAQLLREFFPSADGDRWRAPNAAGGGGGPGGPGGGGGFSSSNSAFAYFGNTNLSSYTANYEIKATSVNTNLAWQRLINAIYVLNTTPTGQLRDTLENVLAVDNWLWLLALENIFVDDDSYWNKGADFGFYYEPESGRIHPIEHDGNETFTATMGIDYTLSPVTGATGNNRPLLYRLLSINELRQRYLAHMRTVLEEYFNPTVMTPLINQFHSLSIAAIIADPNKGFSMTTYTNDLKALKLYVTNRYNYLSMHAELTPLQPNINTVIGPAGAVFATNAPYITAAVTANGTSGLGSVWLYHRGKSYGRFTQVQMFDDGAHGDGASGDGTFGAAATNYPSGSKVRYYVEARGSNAAQAARFSPARAEAETYSYRVSITTASNSPVVINEFMASNTSTLADPQGEYDDWIELHNVTDSSVDLTGRYLCDEPNNPRKWQFPAGTTIPASGYLLVWADEDTTITNGLHASFKLSASDDEIYLTDTDENLNAILDTISYSSQITDLSYGRTSADANVWSVMTPTPAAANQ